MALTPDQQAQLTALEAERDAPEPRTTTGIKGVLHALLDVASGAVAHLPEQAWAQLHRQAEGTTEDAPAGPGDATTDGGPAEGGTY